MINIFLIIFVFANTILNSHQIRMLKSRFVQVDELPMLIHDSLNVQNNKIITLSPGGFKGFYTFGLCKFLKENYDLSEYVFSGASAGAWNSLYLCLNSELDDFVETIFKIDFKNIPDLNGIEQEIKRCILKKYKSEDFCLDKLYIGTTVFKGCRFKTVVYTEFDDLEDAINCCMASSHIPFITGGLFFKYRGLYSFDGGFSRYPYINGNYSNIHITPSIWEKEATKRLLPSLNINDYTSLLSRRKHNLTELYLQGYQDALENKEELDKLFL